MISLEFEGKSAIYSYHNDVELHPLIIDKKLSYNKKPHINDNLIIHGDNLHALKSLLPIYYNKINCIYIDPPYNTGNEKWVYSDNIHHNKQMKTWFNTEVNNDDLNKHDKWLCMMYPRLSLLKELLHDDGIIFISIDDNEMVNLHKLMDEIFGEKNHMGTITVKSNPSGRDYGGISRVHDYVLAYHKGNGEPENIVDQNAEFQYADKYGGYDIRELRNRNIRFNKDNRPNLFYPFYVNEKNILDDGLYSVSLNPKKNWTKVLPLKSQGVQTVWRWGKDKTQKNIDINVRGKLKADGAFQIIEKHRNKLKRIRSILDDKLIRNEHGTKILKEIFDGKSVFDYPKSLELIKNLIDLVTENGDIVLDSFAGSGTTGHAVLDLNSKSKVERKFILIECENYANEITAERIRRVINKNKNTFTYCTLGMPITVENMLKGNNLPDYDILSSHIIHTAGQSSELKNKINKDWKIYENDDTVYYLIYKKDMKFLKSDSSALSIKLAEKIQRYCLKMHKKGIIYASHSNLTSKILAKMNLSFNYIPFDLKL